MRLGKVMVPRLLDATSGVGEAELKVSGYQLLSGGTGALGLVFAHWLAEKGATQLALMSRSGRVADESLAGLFEKAQKAATVQVMQGDIAKREDVKKVMKEVRRVVGTF